MDQRISNNRVKRIGGEEEYLYQCPMEWVEIPTDIQNFKIPATFIKFLSNGIGIFPVVRVEVSGGILFPREGNYGK